jgi:CheY-like chemotaxis protein
MRGNGGVARLLIVDDDQATLEWMDAALSGAGHEVRVAPSAQQALAILDHWTPNLVLSDILMPEIDGWLFSRMVQQFNIPVLLVSIVHGQGEAIVRGCKGASSEAFFPATLRAEVERVLRTHHERPTVLVVDDDEDIRESIAGALGERFRALEAENGSEALKILESATVDLVITDVKMPIMDGRDFVRQLRAEPRLAKLPVIVQTSDTQSARAPLWTDLQVEQVLLKHEFVEWLLARINFHLADHLSA